MTATPLPARQARQNWLSILARASAAEVEAILERHGGLPTAEVLKHAETGTVMLEGRAGGTGCRFNVGEATVTRCVIRLSSGTIGVSYAIGTDRRKAHLAALLDGILQDAEQRADLDAAISRLASEQAERRDVASRKAAATKVEFFTLVRGDG